LAIDDELVGNDDDIDYKALIADQFMIEGNEGFIIQIMNWLAMRLYNNFIVQKNIL